jgi:serine/threonine protein kinase
MSSAGDERCSKCGGTVGATSSGSITQWIAICSCARRHEVPRVAVRICGRCGKRLNSGRAGSLTQWVFRQDLCACMEPIVSTKLLDEFDIISTLPEKPVKAIPTDGTCLNLESTKFPSERYIPIREIGKGGSGIVYYCRDRLLDKVVAVKMLHAVSAAQLLSFQNEARATSKLNHPNIVSVLDFGATSAGVPYMSMELVDGVSLQKLISEGNLFHPETVVSLFCKVADGLSHAHRAGILHRDVTSSNLLISRAASGVPEVRIIDFGVSIVGVGINGQGQTIVGTPRYMPPDQARGEDYDERSEVYEFGCVLFEALTGDTPFLGETSLDLIRQHAEESPPTVSERRADNLVSAELEAVVARCLAKNKIDRFQSMDEVVSALEELCVRTLSFEDSQAKPFDVFAHKGSYLLASLLVVSAVVLVGKLGFDVCTSSEKLTEEKALAVADHGIFGEVMVDACSESLKPRFETKKRHDLDWTIAKGSVTNDSLIQLSRRTDVKRLSLLDDPIDGRALIFVLKLPLVALDLDQTRMRDQDVEVICRFPLLENVSVANTLITERALGGLSKLPNLIDLQIGGPDYTDECLGVVSKFQKLRTLTVRDTKKITASGITKLAVMSELKSITFKNVDIGPEAIGAIGKLEHLIELNIHDNKLAEGAFIRLRGAHLAEIKLKRCLLTDEDLQQLGDLNSLRYLELELTRGFTEAGLKAFRKKKPRCDISVQ